MRNLQFLQTALNPGPGLPAFQFCNPFYKQRQNAHLPMGLYTAGDPLKHWTYLDLGAFQGTKTTLNDHQTLVSAVRIL